MKAHHKRHRRVAIDVIILLFAFLAVLGVIVGNVRGVRNGEQEASRLAHLAGADSNFATSTDKVVLTVSARDKNEESGVEDTSAEATSQYLGNALVDGQPNNLSSGDTLEPAETELHPTNMREWSFRDVTVNRYENTRLGFVMELPEGWSLRYEHNDEVAFANAVASGGATLADIRKYPEAAWVVIGRTCVSTDATSTTFATLGENGAPTREHHACVPPLKIILGTRSDVKGVEARQSFLLDISRTIYPMVR